MNNLKKFEKSNTDNLYMNKFVNNNKNSIIFNANQVKLFKRGRTINLIKKNIWIIKYINKRFIMENEIIIKTQI